MSAIHEGARARRAAMLAAVLLLTAAAWATIFGAVRGVVHDPDHRPTAGATVTIKANDSAWATTVASDNNGEFRVQAVPIGRYEVVAEAPGFAAIRQDVTVVSGSEPVLHFALKIAPHTDSATVTASPAAPPEDTATPTTLVGRLDVAHTPGADRSNSLAMVTSFVPGATIAHDQLHVRGGHQVSWMVDGVPVPNTNIAGNVGPQFDPNDIDYLEVNRGSYGAEYGDRTYAAFNIAPRTGFERNREAELVTSFGSYQQTNDQFSLGSHTERFAYYASVNGNRSELGLQPAVARVVHDAQSGYGGFGSLIFNARPKDQLRLVVSLRRDYYQVPVDPDPASFANSQYASYGLRDGQHESDAIVNFSWVRTINSRLLVTVSPFFHATTANYESAANDWPAATTSHHASSYFGGQVSAAASLPRNNLQVGAYTFYQRDRQLLAVAANDGSAGLSPAQTAVTGALGAFFVNDRFKATKWLTLIAGMRPTYFSGSLTESAISPRLGVAVTVPRLHWVVRGFWGQYYQAPPLVTASGPLLEFVTNNNLGFLPLRGERDEEYQFGLTVPWRGWTVEVNNFRTLARNYFDHSSVGESNLFFPLTIERASIRGWELTLRSPVIARRGQLHLAYSNQVALAGGAITGGLTDFSLPEGMSLLDHDQRHTLSAGGWVNLPRRSLLSGTVSYGSGFANGLQGTTGWPYAGDHLPGHTTFDLSLGKSLGERLSLSLNAINVANRRVLLDSSVTFGGFHWNTPREVYAQLRWRFKY